MLTDKLKKMPENMPVGKEYLKNQMQTLYLIASVECL